jgi:hypothetical protein
MQIETKSQAKKPQRCRQSFLMPLLLKSSACFIISDSETPSPCAKESPKFKVGFLMPLSMRLIMVESQSAFSAKRSCEIPRSFRCVRRTIAKFRAMSFRRIPAASQTD